MTGPANGQRALDEVRGYYDKSAPQYDGWLRGFDKVMLGGGRSRLCSRARGVTLEIAVGTGANLVHYPPDADITGIDLSEQMLALAGRRAKHLGRDAALCLGDAQSLPFPDRRFDTVVATLLLSTVPDPHRAVSEMWRVLKCGRRLLLLDMARSPVGPVRGIENLLEPLTARSRFTLMRDPLDYLDRVGFIVEHAARYRFGVVEEVVARKM